MHSISLMWFIQLLFLQWPGSNNCSPIVGGQIVQLSGESIKNNSWRLSAQLELITKEIPRFSYIVSLQDRIRFGNGTVLFKHFCGGSLISFSWILTAGHCIHYKKANEVVAAIGILNLKSNDVEHREIDSFKVMNFVAYNLKNDIALVKLKIPVLAHKGFSLGVVPSLGMKASRKKPCKIIGYGADQYGGSIQNNLKVGEVFAISRQRCKRILGKIMAPQEGDFTVCGLGDLQDSCQGDSGGPLICPVKGRDYIFGIVSHGITCGQRGVPSIYTVTIPYKKWIERIIKQ